MLGARAAVDTTSLVAESAQHSLHRIAHHVRHSSSSPHSTSSSSTTNTVVKLRRRQVQGLLAGANVALSEVLVVVAASSYGARVQTRPVVLHRPHVPPAA